MRSLRQQIKEIRKRQETKMIPSTQQVLKAVFLHFKRIFRTTGVGLTHLD